MVMITGLTSIAISKTDLHPIALCFFIFSLYYILTSWTQNTFKNIYVVAEYRLPVTNYFLTSSLALLKALPKLDP